MKTLNFKKVLIAVDYDQTAQKVAEVGFSLASCMNAQTILLHVIAERPVYYSDYMYMGELRVNIMPDLNTSTQEFLDKLKNHLGDTTIQTLVKKGEVAETILTTAIELNADMIVMGSHSRKWLENIIMGSETADVLRNTMIPLFIVPTKKEPD